MAQFKPKFTLKHSKAETKSEIVLRVYYDYNTFAWDVKDGIGRVLKIYPQLWDKKNQYPVPKGKIPLKFRNETCDLQTIGETIDKLKVYVNEIVNETALTENKISNDLLRKQLELKMGFSEKENKITIHHFCLHTIREMEEGTLLIDATKRYTQSTIDKYKYTAQILEVFKPNTTISHIDKDWYNAFIQFLTNKQSIPYKDKDGNEKKFEKKDLQPGSISNYVKNVKFLMGYAVEKGISTNKNHLEKWFTRPKEQKGFGNIQIALNESELMQIYNFNPASIGLNSTYDIAKDLFLVGCYTGLRVSDFNTGLSAKDFKTVEIKGKKEQVLTIPTQKTGSTSYIPAIWDELKLIFEKYNYQLPVLAENTIRKYTQKICEDIKGLDGVKSWYITLGGRTQKIEKSKWQMVGNHTGRRSFITNLKNRGYSFDDIGEITGQTTTAIIKEYYKTPKEEGVVTIKNRHEKN
jgi:hypothetical protein